MSDLENVKKEVTSFIAAKVDNGEIINLGTLVHEIVARKSGITGPDADFHRSCTFHVVHDVSKACVARYNAKSQKAQTIPLPGFEYLQVAYPVTRNKISLLVPIEQMRDDELLKRAEEYRRMGSGCNQHAKEIRGYVAKRRAANDNKPTADKAA